MKEVEIHNKITALQSKKMTLNRIQKIDRRLKELMASQDVTEYLCLIEERKRRKKEYERETREHNHKVLIFNGFQKCEKETLLEQSDGVLEEAVYYCLSCGTIITIPVTRRFEEITRFERRNSIVIRPKRKLNQEALERLKDYYSSLLSSGYNEEDAIRIFNSSYEGQLGGKTML